MELSIIIPVYNVEQYLEECLNSLVNLNISEYEIILINDGSTDNSPDIIAKYAEAYPDLIKSYTQSNAGLSTTRNRGIMLANGKYISFIDSDDYIIADEFEKFWNNIKDGDLDVAIAAYQIETDGVRGNLMFGNRKQKRLSRLGVTDGQTYLKKAFDYYKDYVNVEVVTQIYKKEFLIKNDLSFTTGLLHEDTLFSISVYLKANRLAFFANTFYIYRMRSGSIMHSVSTKNYESIWYIAQRIHELSANLKKNIVPVDSIIVNLIYEACKCPEVIDDKEKIYSMLKGLKKLTLRAFMKKMLLITRK